VFQKIRQDFFNLLGSRLYLPTEPLNAMDPDAFIGAHHSLQEASGPSRHIINAYPHGTALRVPAKVVTSRLLSVWVPVRQPRTECGRRPIGPAISAATPPVVAQHGHPLAPRGAGDRVERGGRCGFGDQGAVAAAGLVSVVVRAGEGGAVVFGLPSARWWS
jgi:hypothetical protein